MSLSTFLRLLIFHNKMLKISQVTGDYDVAASLASLEQASSLQTKFSYTALQSSLGTTLGKGSWYEHSVWFPTSKLLPPLFVLI